MPLDLNEILKESERYRSLFYPLEISPEEPSSAEPPEEPKKPWWERAWETIKQPSFWSDFAKGLKTAPQTYTKILSKPFEPLAKKTRQSIDAFLRQKIKTPQGEISRGELLKKWGKAFYEATLDNSKWDEFEKIDKIARENWLSPAQYAEWVGLAGTLALGGLGALQGIQSLTQTIKSNRAQKLAEEVGKKFLDVYKAKYPDIVKTPEDAAAIARLQFENYVKQTTGKTLEEIPFITAMRGIGKLIQMARTFKLPETKGLPSPTITQAPRLVSPIAKTVTEGAEKVITQAEKTLPAVVDKIKDVVSRLNIDETAKEEFIQTALAGKQPDFAGILGRFFNRLGEEWGLLPREEQKQAMQRHTEEMKKAWEKIQEFKEQPAEPEKAETFVKEVKEKATIAPEEATKEDALKEMVTLMVSEVEQGKPGRRIRTEEGEWIREPSTYPDWMGEIGVSKKEITRALDLYEQTGKKNAVYKRLEDKARELLTYGYDSPFFGHIEPHPAFQPEEIEFFAGPGIPKSTREFLWKLVKPVEEPIIGVEKAVAKWEAESNEALLQGKLLRDNIEKMLKTKDIPKERLTLIDKYLEEPEKYAGELEPEEIEVAHQIRRIFDSLGHIAQQKGVLDAWIENYVPHLYKDDPKTVYQKLFPAGGRKLGTGFRFARKRVIPTSDEAEKLGLHPVRDVGLKAQIYATSLFRTLANKRLLDTLMQMKNEEGLPLIITRPQEAPPHYEFVTEPAFWKYMYVGEKEVGEGKKEVYLTKVPAKADPRVAKILNDILSPTLPYNKWLKAYVGAQNTVRRLIMYNPLIHGFNIFSDVLDEANFNFIKATNVVFRGKVPKNLLEKFSYKNLDELDLDMVKHGVSSEAIVGISNDLYNTLNNLQNTEASKILSPILKLRDLNDKVLWQRMVASSQRFVYLANLNRILKKNPNMDVDRAKELAAHYTNDLLGTLPKTIFTKKQGLLLRILLFARNWTVSNLRLITGALSKAGTSKILPGFLRHKGISPEEMKVISPLYRKHLAKGIIGLILSTVIVNSLIKSAQEEKPTVWVPWEAEEGHWFDIDTGLRDKRGRKIYIKSPLFRYIGDYIGWGTEPTRTLYNKMEPITKNLIEQLVNYSAWQRKPITEKEGVEGLKERVEYFARGTTPLGTVYGVTQPAARGFEKLIPLTGTWVRHGISTDLTTRFQTLPRDDREAFLEKELSPIEQKVFIDLLFKQMAGVEFTKEEADKAAKFAKKLIDYRRKLKTKWVDIDKKIDELILKGDIWKAYDIAFETGRYKTWEGFEDRVRRVTGGKTPEQIME